MPSTIKIGELIRDELHRQKHTNGWLAERIGVNPRTINKIFCKTVIDTQQLLLISQALQVDFFKTYSDVLDMGMPIRNQPNTSHHEKKN